MFYVTKSRKCHLLCHFLLARRKSQVIPLFVQGCEYQEVGITRGYFRVFLPYYLLQFRAVTQSCPTLRSYEPQHARLPCSSPTPGACSNSCPLNWWCYPTISSSVIPFSSYLQSFPASGSFPVSQLFASGGQSIHCSFIHLLKLFSFNISLSSEYSGLIYFRMDWFDLLAIQGTLKSLFQHHSSKASILRCSAFFIVQPSVFQVHSCCNIYQNFSPF